MNFDRNFISSELNFSVRSRHVSIELRPFVWETTNYRLISSSVRINSSAVTSNQKMGAWFFPRADAMVFHLGIAQILMQLDWTHPRLAQQKQLKYPEYPFKLHDFSSRSMQIQNRRNHDRHN